MSRIVLYLLLVLFLVGCQTESTNSLSTDLVVFSTINPSSTDLHLDSTPITGFLARQVYDTLVYRHPETFEIVPGLAERWEISEDGLTYTFYLKQGVTFHDGTALTADTVATNFDRIVNLPASPAIQQLIGSYYRSEIVDNYTIQLLLSEPYAPFLDGLCHPNLGMISSEALATHSSLRYQFYQIGTGPYQWIDFVPGRYVVLRPNPDYQWGPDFYTDRLPLLGDIRIEFSDDIGQKVESLTADNLTLIYHLAPENIAEVVANAEAQIIPYQPAGMNLQFQVNTELYPTDTLLVRKALLWSLNRTELIDRFFYGVTVPAYGPLSQNSLYYSNEMTSFSGYSFNQSREFLGQAGYEDSDNNGIYDINSLDLEIRVFVTSGLMSLDMINAVQQQWRVIGIDSQFDIAPSLALIGNDPDAYHLIAVPLDTGVDSALLSRTYSSTGLYNLFGYQNDTLDELLQQGTSGLSEVERATAYVLAQRHIMENAIILPVVSPLDVYVTSATLQNLQFDPYGHLLLRELTRNE